jgi:Fe-S-cluster containining protein
VAARFPSSGDQKLIQIVDAALADTTLRSKGGLVCRKGCTPCCIGVFAINQLDALRLRRGLEELAFRDPERAAAIRQRARDSVARLSRDFPGDPATGLLGKTKEQRQRFEDFANEEPCPALDLDEGTCDLYDSRPMTCRTFGPPMRVEGGGLGVCELCYQGFSEKEIAACEMIPDPEDLESRLVEEIEKSTGRRGDTIIAFSLAA